MSSPDPDTNQNIAVKVLKEGVSNEAREDFEREVEIMSAFDHDNILKLLGIVADSKDLFYIQSTPVISKSKWVHENTSRYPYLDISDLQN